MVVEFSIFLAPSANNKMIEAGAYIQGGPKK